jgi:imidazolonepropionase-like amidohydrolase
MKTLMTNVVIYPITSTPFKGEMLVEDGIIKELAYKVKDRENIDDIIDGKGGLLMPGFVDGHSHIGLNPDGLGYEYDDTNEYSDPVTSNVRSLDGFAPTDISIPEAAMGGVMIYCVLTGSANPVGGLSFTAHYSREKNTNAFLIAQDTGLKMATGENPKRVYGEQKKMPVTRMGTAAVIRKFFFDGKDYMAKKAKAAEEGKDFTEHDNKLEAAQMVLEKKIPARVHCHRAEDILTALRIKKEFDIDMVIEHCTEYIKVKDQIKEAGVPILLGPIMSSRSKVELKDMTYKSYKVALDEGILFGCMSDHPVFPSEVLRLQAGMACNYGADEEGMLKSLTIMPAKILGLDGEYGSLEVGKKATMCIWDGHPFDARSKTIWNSVDGFIDY